MSSQLRRAHAAVRCVVGLAAVAGLAALLAGCGGTADGSTVFSQNRKAVTTVLARGRIALLRGDGRRACALLTTHGRRRALNFQVDYAPEGTKIPTRRKGVPQTCAALVHREWKDEHAPNVDPSWTPALKHGHFVILRLSLTRARAALKTSRPTEPVRVTLKKHRGRWRLDDSNVAPAGY